MTQERMKNKGKPQSRSGSQTEEWPKGQKHTNTHTANKKKKNTYTNADAF